MREKYHCDRWGKPPKAWYVAFDRAVHFGSWELAKELLQEVHWQVHYVKEWMAEGDPALVTRTDVIEAAESHGLGRLEYGEFYIPRGHPSWTPDLKYSEAAKEAMAEEARRKVAASEKIERIRNGTRPTAMLREIMAENPGISWEDLGMKFGEELCAPVKGLMIVMSRWHVYREDGYDDETFDRVVATLVGVPVER